MPPSRFLTVNTTFLFAPSAGFELAWARTTKMTGNWMLVLFCLGDFKRILVTACWNPAAEHYSKLPVPSSLVNYSPNALCMRSIQMTNAAVLPGLLKQEGSITKRVIKYRRGVV